MDQNTIIRVAKHHNKGAALKIIDFFHNYGVLGAQGMVMWCVVCILFEDVGIAERPAGGYSFAGRKFFPLMSSVSCLWCSATSQPVKVRMLVADLALHPPVWSTVLSWSMICSRSWLLSSSNIASSWSKLNACLKGNISSRFTSSSCCPCPRPACCLTSWCCCSLAGASGDIARGSTFPWSGTKLSRSCIPGRPGSIGDANANDYWSPTVSWKQLSRINDEWIDCVTRWLIITQKTQMWSQLLWWCVSQETWFGCCCFRHGWLPSSLFFWANLCLAITRAHLTPPFVVRNHSRSAFFEAWSSCSRSSILVDIPLKIEHSFERGALQVSKTRVTLCYHSWRTTCVGSIWPSQVATPKRMRSPRWGWTSRT